MKVSDRVISVITKKYGAKFNHSSNQKKGSTLIYDFPSYGGYQLAVRENKEKLTLYVNAKTRDGKNFEHYLPEGSIEKRYPEDGNPPASLLSELYAPFLTPKKNRNKLLRIKILLEDLPRLISIYLGAITPESEPKTTTSNNEEDEIFSDANLKNKNKKKISLQDLENRLADQREIGKHGEDTAYRHEYVRLTNLGCANPTAHIKQLSEDDVGAGYDLTSEFKGEKRFIEVKASVVSNESFFISENERVTLMDLGSDAYIYLVKVDRLDKKNSKVVDEIRNPIADSSVILEPVAYKVTRKKLNLLN